MDTRSAGHSQEIKHQVAADWKDDATAAAWQKHYGRMKRQFAEVTRAIVDAANPQPGESVLDLASGTGEPALSLAQRVGPAGTVTASDLSEAMLSALRHNAAEERITNVKTQVADMHELPFRDGSFNLVTSRFGIMFAVEIDRALAEFRRVLKPVGRIAFLVWGAPAEGTYFGTAVMPFMRRLAEKPDPDGPGPMRFAEPGKLVRLVEKAGYQEVREVLRTVSAPYPGTPEQFMDDVLEIAVPFRNAVATLSEKDAEAARQEAYGNLRKRSDGQQINITAPFLIVTAYS